MVGPLIHFFNEEKIFFTWFSKSGEIEFGSFHRVTSPFPLNYNISVSIKIGGNSMILISETKKVTKKKTHRWDVIIFRYIFHTF